MQRLLLLLIVIFSSFFLQNSSLNARPTLGPPSINLRSNISNIIVAQLNAVEGNTLTFNKIKDIHNTEKMEQVSITVDDWVAESLLKNNTYIVAYIAWGASRQPKRIFPRPGGPVLMNMAGAEPSIYTYSKDLEQMLSWEIEQSLTSPKQMLPILLRGIDVPDQQLHNFFITELVTRPQLYEQMTQSDLNRLINLLSDPTLAIKSKHFMLAQPEFIQALNIAADDYCRILQDTLSFLPVHLDLNSAQPALARTAIINARSCGLSVMPIPVVSRWVLSNSTAVVESALKSLRHLQEGTDIQAIEMALEQTFLPQQSREVLLNYQRRMDPERRKSHHNKKSNKKQ